MAICVEGDTLDDVMRHAISELMETGAREAATPVRGSNIESIGARLQLNNPRARLSQTESRRREVSAIGELAWYLSGSNEAAQIAFWIPRYNLEAETDGRVHGGYGPRLFGQGPNDQFKRVIEQLRQSPGTRRAVVQIFDRSDTFGERKKDVPCTCTMQFLQRAGKLHMVVAMRSNDAVFGLPHDIFTFTMLQEIAANELGLELGEYVHLAASLHMYDKSRGLAESFLSEGWQSTAGAQMPAMPSGPQTLSLAQFITAESQVRAGVSYQSLDLPSEAYWADLIRLLALRVALRSRDGVGSETITLAMVNEELAEFARLLGAT